MTFAIVNAHVVPVDGDPFDGILLVQDGVISALGTDVEIPDGIEVIDAEGQWLLPGFVDAHVHLGIHEQAEGWAGDDTNEMTNPVTAAVRALDAINPREIGFDDALGGGVTAVNVNPGSGNAIGGLAVAIKTHGRVVDEMILKSPSGLKAALGENPKRVYGDKKQTPSTRLGIAYTIRNAFTEARNYEAKRAAAGDGAVPVDLVNEALLQVLRREIPWRQHSHRADDIATAMRIAEEFGYELVLDHGTESHLIADLVAAKSIPVLYGPMIVSRSKVEVRQRTTRAPGILDAAGVKVCLITDHPVVPIEYLVQQAALASREGMPYERALRAITIHPAEVMGVADRVGSLAVGKDADLVLWSGDPFDIRERAMRVFIDGNQVYHFDTETGEGVTAPR